MTSIPEVSARGSLTLWAKFQIPIGPRPFVGPRSGREGEKCQPLDHMRHIPFIHQLCSHVALGYIYILYKTVPVISSKWYLHYVLKHCTFVIYACALSEPLSSGFSALLKSFSVVSGMHWNEIQRDTAIKTRHRCTAIDGVGAVNARILRDYERKQY